MTENEDDNADGRHESANERSDRNWNEMLQETRITQTGTQILSGFLLTIAFQPRFATLTAFQHVVYLALVIAATLTTALALAPVYLHRRLFQRHQKATVVQYGHRLLSWALAGLVVVMTGTVLLIFDVAVGLDGGVTAGAFVLLAIVLLAALPARRARRSSGGGTAGPGSA
jgi:Family of unknown function (DUF6328)